MLERGLPPTYRGQPWSLNCRQWVYFDCYIDTAAVRRRFDLARVSRSTPIEAPTTDRSAASSARNATTVSWADTSGATAGSFRVDAAELRHAAPGRHAAVRASQHLDYKRWHDGIGYDVDAMPR